jgi:hypothetical protein
LKLPCEHTNKLLDLRYLEIRAAYGKKMGCGRKRGMSDGEVHAGRRAMSDPLLTRYACEDFRYACWWAWRELGRMIHAHLVTYILQHQRPGWTK